MMLTEVTLCNRLAWILQTEGLGFESLTRHQQNQRDKPNLLENFKTMDSNAASSEQSSSIAAMRLRAFDVLAEQIGLDVAEKRLKELRRPPKGATRDPQKSRERLAVALALEEG